MAVQNYKVITTLNVDNITLVAVPYYGAIPNFENSPTLWGHCKTTGGIKTLFGHYITMRAVKHNTGSTVLWGQFNNMSTVLQI